LQQNIILEIIFGKSQK